MSHENVVSAALSLASKDEESLLLEIGLREEAILRNPALGSNPTLHVSYNTTHMGLIADAKALGLRVVKRWNTELYGIICGGKDIPSPKLAPVDGPNSDPALAAITETLKFRQDLFSSLNLNDAAVIAVVTTGLLYIGVPAAISAAVAPLLVKRFIAPAKDELCAAWGERLAD